MANKKDIHYNIDNIDKIGARFNLIYGERSNGKSYQVKHKKAVEKYIKTGKRFILMRRLREEITSEKIEQYFQDVDVAKLTNNKYNCITLYRKILYFSKYDFCSLVIVMFLSTSIALSTEATPASFMVLSISALFHASFTSSIVLKLPA